MRIIEKMDLFMDMIKRDPNEQIKTKDMLDKYNSVPYNCQSKTG